MKIPYKKFLLAIWISLGSAYANSVVEYSGKPVIVTVSDKVANVINFPEPIKEVFSSSKDLKVNFAQGNTKLVVSVPDKPVDLIVFTKSGKLYTLNLDPAPLPSQVITIVPNKKKAQKKEAQLFEEKNDYENLIAELIRSTANDSPPQGYDVQPFEKTLDTPDIIFTCEAKYTGWEYAVYKCVMLNKSNKKLWLRETSPLMRRVIPELTSQSWKSIRAISFERDVLFPRGKGAWYSKLYVVTENPESTLSAIYDRIKR